eukprot:748402-Hanusia_phi.AAC.3
MGLTVFSVATTPKKASPTGVSLKSACRSPRHLTPPLLLPSSSAPRLLVSSPQFLSCLSFLVSPPPPASDLECSDERRAQGILSLDVQQSQAARAQGVTKATRRREGHSVRSWQRRRRVSRTAKNQHARTR